jgi:succinate dehydrogenase/fumarate reductase flavoprotein subunit
VEQVDVIVLGTGAAGLTAAVAAHGHGATVLVLEKAGLVGGTSAMSGGTVWIPCNDQMLAFGISDSREEALTYLRSLSHGRIRDELAEAYVDHGVEMVRWLEANTPVHFELVERFPDYHPEHPGGKAKGGRSIECPLFAFDELGDWAPRLTVSKQMKGNVVLNETTLGRGVVGGVAQEEYDRRAIRDERGCGQALMGRLLKACLDRGIEPRTGQRAVELLTIDGVVSGVVVENADGRVEIGARRGVILATGGFEHNPELVRSFLRGPLERTVAIETNTGDGLVMAMRIGVALGNMGEAWWTPIIDVPDAAGEMFSWMVNRERIRPHCIMVNRAGRRFANEAANYNAFGAAFHHLDPGTFDYPNIPAWMLFDAEYLRRGPLYTFDGTGPTPSWLTCAPTLRELAAAIGASPDGLEASVARWNGHAETLEDPDFGRGRSVNDTHWGDGTPGPGATIGPVDCAPYYAVRVRPGALGTKGGPSTTPDGQVVDVDGRPIEGLYAAGNVMASAMGMTYGGGGGTLGPGMVFGFLAGRHAAGANA